MSFSWQCPFCNKHATITDSQISTFSNNFNNNNKHNSDLRLIVHTIVCPNPDCKEYEITAQLGTPFPYDSVRLSKPLQEWTLRPQSSALVLPDYIPKAIIIDYNEACAVKNLSPKSSATLSRRCLQGLIRDFWQEKVKPGRLVDEIKSIQDAVDPLTWAAIDGVRRIGNIGAHMEKDINVIVDVEPQEADLLIKLIETLIKDWYINRHERQLQLEALIGLDEQKQADRKANKAS